MFQRVSWNSDGVPQVCWDCWQCPETGGRENPGLCGRRTEQAESAGKQNKGGVWKQATGFARGVGKG